MKKNLHAVALGRKGGKVKSEAKTKTAQENGKKGGRPKKSKEIDDELAAHNGDSSKEKL